MRGYLGVGLRSKDMTSAHESRPQRDVVFDDAVVNEREVAVAVKMGVRVLVGRASVGGPARVAERGVAEGQRVGTQTPLQHRQRTGLATYLHRAVRELSDTGRVVATIFEMTQAIEHHLSRWLGSDVGHDAAHCQHSRSRTIAASSPAMVSASSRVGASTITRTTGSVPLGRSNTRPDAPSWCWALATACSRSLSVCARDLSTPSTLIKTCGSRVITAARSASDWPVSATRLSTCSAVRIPSPVVACSSMMTWPLCSPPRV